MVNLFYLTFRPNAKIQISYVGDETTGKCRLGPILTIVLESDSETLMGSWVTGMQKMDKRLPVLQTNCREKLLSWTVSRILAVSLEGRSAGVLHRFRNIWYCSQNLCTWSNLICGSSRQAWVVDGVIMENVPEVSADELSSGHAGNVGQPGYCRFECR